MQWFWSWITIRMSCWSDQRAHINYKAIKMNCTIKLNKHNTFYHFVTVLVIKTRGFQDHHPLRFCMYHRWAQCVCTVLQSKSGKAIIFCPERFENFAFYLFYLGYSNSSVVNISCLWFYLFPSDLKWGDVATFVIVTKMGWWSTKASKAWLANRTSSFGVLLVCWTRHIYHYHFCSVTKLMN